MEDHAEWELGSKEGEKPLGSIHMSFQVLFQEMAIQIRELLLQNEVKERKG